MKSRRLTIFCVALIAVVGTPRAWQEVSKLLAFAQHKAQVKFWSMVMQPEERDSADIALVAAAQTLRDTACPSERGEEAPQNYQASAKAKTDRKALSVQPKARAPQQPEILAAAHPALIARAPKALGEGASLEHVRYFKGVSSVQPPIATENLLATPASPGAPALPSAAGGKADAFRYVLMPTPDPATMAVFEKDALIQLKVLRKSFEDNKLSRPKSRLRAGKSVPPSAAAFSSL
jgi:hypothetical protein